MNETFIHYNITWRSIKKFLHLSGVNSYFRNESHLRTNLLSMRTKKNRNYEKTCVSKDVFNLRFAAFLMRLSSVFIDFNCIRRRGTC